jgi:thiamine-phosphate pyrophosphorylase
LIGNSNGGIEEALRSQEDAVDYIAVGAIYATTTMGKSGRRSLGPGMITRVKAEVAQPIVAIGGINSSNIQDVVRAGADSVCVVSAITFAGDPKAATEELVRLYESVAD